MPIPEHVLGNVFVRPNCGYKRGDVCEGHAHHFDHVTFVTRGSFRIDRRWPDGRTETIVVGGPGSAAYDGRWYVLITAECTHRLEALEDHSDFFCVYAHRDPQAGVVQHYTGWQEAYT